MPGPNKVSVILDIPVPKSNNELLSFLELTIYLGKGLSRLAEVGAPLRKYNAMPARLALDVF